MNREIKFRGLRSDGKGWVYGYLVQNEKITGIIPCDKIVFTDDGSDLDFTYVEVIPESVGQYTGLKDKEGKEIYEGDIIKWTYGEIYWEAVVKQANPSNNLYAIETFNNCSLDGEDEVVLERSDSRRGARNDMGYMSSSKTTLVIGNIHEHKHLLS